MPLHLDAAKREGIPVEQGTRDSIQLAINALERARDSTTMFAFIDYTTSALLEIQGAVAIQRVQEVDLESQNDILREFISK